MTKRAKIDPLPPQACKYGYTVAQIREIVDSEYHFGRWMRGQTSAICDGREYDHDTKTYNETGCGPHGPVVYLHDLKRYIDGGPIVD